MMELLTKSSVMDEISNYIEELKKVNTKYMGDRIFAANVILDKVRRMEPDCILHMDLDNSNIQTIKNEEE